MTGADAVARRAGGWRHLGTLVLAHAVAVAGGSVVLALTALVQDQLGWSGTVATTRLVALGGAIFVVLFGVVAGAVLALPASLLAYPLALAAVRRGVRGSWLLLLGGAAGLLIGLPLLVVTISIGDLARLLETGSDTARSAVTSFGPAAAAAGMGFAWIVGRRG